MSAIKKEELAALEARYGLEPEDLTYQQRCSRITAIMKGEEWERPAKQGTSKPRQKLMQSDPKNSPIWGKRILITPLMVPDKNRNVYYEEIVGHDIEVRDVDAGEALYNQPEEIDRMVGDYKIIRENKNRPVMAKTTFPKIGTEISWNPSEEVVPVVRGNDGQRAYLWFTPPRVIQVEDTLVQIYGLKTLLKEVYPELLTKFRGKPIMTYVDGVTLEANIPLTNAILKEARRKAIQDEKLGLV